MKLTRKHLAIAVVLIILWIVLPTGTPEDAITTILFIKLFGLQGYMIMLWITLLVCGIILSKVKK